MVEYTVAVVPARGGSKGVPRKNMRLVGGRPLIHYTLDAACAAKKIDRIVVTTDDADIAEICASYDRVEIICRPTEISQDDSPVIDAVQHAIQGMEPDAIVLLQPTSPFRTGTDIDEAISLFRASDLIPVCSVCQAGDAHPARMYRIEGGILSSFMPDLAELRRQELPPVFHRNGAIYVFGQRELKRGKIIVDPMIPYVMAHETSVNVDTELDLLLLEAILRNKDENSDPRA
jgi:CMP-N,N'-diacetyllegionaminic acid synthase